jgi:hypothetical protein
VEELSWQSARSRACARWPPAWRRAAPPGTSERIDEAYRIIVRQRRPVAEVCADVIAFVTPGLRVSIAGAKDGGDGTWSVETRSDRPLTIAAA